MLSVQFNQFPVIETRRLILRQPIHEDAGALFRLRTNDAVMQFIGRPRPGSIEEVMTYIDRLRKDFDQSLGITWIMVAKETESAIGTMGFWRMDKENHRAEIGYLLDPAFQGIGLAGEAIHAVLGYGFNALRFHAVEANVDPLNIASKKLLLKSGFVQEGYFRESYFFEGRFIDSAIFGLLCHEYQPGLG
jgi:[ribosomal protein S5]-alanine N-acetyltransferase